MNAPTPVCPTCNEPSRPVVTRLPNGVYYVDYVCDFCGHVVDKDEEGGT